MAHSCEGPRETVQTPRNVQGPEHTDVAKSRSLYERARHVLELHRDQQRAGGHSVYRAVREEAGASWSPNAVCWAGGPCRSFLKALVDSLARQPRDGPPEAARAPSLSWAAASPCRSAVAKECFIHEVVTRNRPSLYP